MTKEFFRGSFIALMMTGVGQGLTLLLHLGFARLAGAEEYGLYASMMALLGAGLVIAKLGFDSSLVRFVATYISSGKPARATSVIRIGLSMVMRVGFAVGSALFIIGWLVLAKNAPFSASVLVFSLLILLVPIGAAAEVTSGALRGFRRPAHALLGDSLVRPLVALALMAVLSAFELTEAFWLAAAYACGTFASYAASTFMLSKCSPVPGRIPSSRITRAWVGASLVQMLASGFLVLLYTVDVVLVGTLSGTTEAGYFSVAVRLAQIVIFVTNIAQYVGSPMMAIAYAEGSRSSLSRTLRMINTLSVGVSLVMAVSMIAFREQLLSLFGDAFASAGSILVLLVLMQLLNAFTGPAGTLLTMTGNQRALANILGFASVVHIVSCFLFIPRYGAIAAAWSALVVHTMWNVAAAVIVWRRLGVDCTIGVLLRRQTGAT